MNILYVVNSISAKFLSTILEEVHSVASSVVSDCPVCTMSEEHISEPVSSRCKYAKKVKNA